MLSKLSRASLSLAVLLTCGPWDSAFAQVVERVGNRALGMGGAFVAVASDSSATWWNPAGLAAGPFFDVSLARATTEHKGTSMPSRDSITSWSVASLPVGFSYYRFRVTDIRLVDPIADAVQNRENGRAEVPLPHSVRSLAASQYGVTVLQTLLPGVHAGATLNYVRGAVALVPGEGRLTAGELMDRGDRLDTGDADGGFDFDVGLMAVAGPLKFGAVARHLRESSFGQGPGEIVLPRQVRAGIAFDGDAADWRPLIIALDVDLTMLETPNGSRRNVAAGAEYWVWNRRLGVRGGGRINAAKRDERTGTVGVSVAARPGMFLEGHLVRGGAAGDAGWGTGARVTF